MIAQILEKFLAQLNPEIAAEQIDTYLLHRFVYLEFQHGFTLVFLNHANNLIHKFFADCFERNSYGYRLDHFFTNIHKQVHFFNLEIKFPVVKPVGFNLAGEQHSIARLHVILEIQIVRREKGKSMSVGKILHRHPAKRLAGFGYLMFDRSDYSCYSQVFSL